MAVLSAKPAFWWLSLASASSSIMGYGMFFWLPSLFVRSYHMSLVQVSIFYGGVTLVGGVLGIWAGGWLADRYGDRSKAAYAIVPAVTLLLSVPFYIVGAMLDTLSWAFAIFVIPGALTLAWLGPVTAAMQQLVPANMRAVASAVFLFINNLIGLGCGSLIIGALSDAMAARFGTESLRYAVMAGTGFYLLSALLFALAARHIGRDWHKADAPAR
jgi:MFS family permease